MELNDIANSRLISQQIAQTELTTAKEIASRMGALQAQDFAMVKWALGARLPKETDSRAEALATLAKRYFTSRCGFSRTGRGAVRQEERPISSTLKKRSRSSALL